MASEYRKWLKILGFTPKENTNGIFVKKYSSHKNYAIEVSFENKCISYGKKIKSESKTTQNFSQAENWVVLECVNRLLEKGYEPKNIVLEKTWKTGHGTSGRLDILVKKDKSSYLMIECKTCGKEYDKEYKNLKKDGGQLFTYFQQDKNAEILMLYTSEFGSEAVRYENCIIKIEEDYRQTSNVNDLYDRWNKIPKLNGVFDDWAYPYQYKPKALIKASLKPLKDKDSSFIFNRFLEILRHNVVSDKPNAFNKIFTLFLCKIIDEDRSKNDELHFQWIEGKDDHISFQKRLIDLYTRGMRELLEKEVTDVTDSEFDKQFEQVKDEYKSKFKDILTEIRLKKNNEFAIKEVYDNASFEENAKVVKEIVELLQEFQLRYNYRQQFLSDFFELLLTTGLKQESGQFFTPVPIARFIVRSLPLQTITINKIESGSKNDLLPVVIDYAAGSGHFITESMEEIQNIIEKIDYTNLSPTTKKTIKRWNDDQFEWAERYVYGIEKDYRLVKTAKVSCYLHGDGLAKVIHGDGLGDFKTAPEFKDLLAKADSVYKQDNKQFDVLVSNPPYSVSAFKGQMNNDVTSKAFDLYSRITDQSSEIECLFVERTKQLLKDGGVSGIILPSSILSNTGIYIQTREILLKYFEIIAIAEMGSNTFMATGTNTITLFIRRRNNADASNINKSIGEIFNTSKDITVNGIEKPIEKYVTHVWDDIKFADYKTLLQKTPNIKIQQHEIYLEYMKKISVKGDETILDQILTIEKEKLLYFILGYSQKVVLIKTGEKSKEKSFLGYEFSNRRGREGIHPIERSKTIDECTKLYDSKCFDNPEKASTYINEAFNGKFDLTIPDSLKDNVSYQNLVDMLTFDRVDFEKNISLAVKKKVRYENIWNSAKLELLSSVAKIQKGTTITKEKSKKGNIPVVAGGQKPAYYHNKSNRQKNVITISASGAYAGFVNYFEMPIFASDCNTVISNDENIMPTKLIFYFLNSIQSIIYDFQRGQAQPHVYKEDISKIKIPLPSKNIQKKIVVEIERLENQEQKCIQNIINLNNQINDIFSSQKNAKNVKLEDVVTSLKRGKSAKYGSSSIQIIKSGQARGFRKFDFSVKHYVAEGFVLDERQLQKGDILINSSGVGTAGRVTLFDLEGVFVVDSHVTILRPNKDVALSDYVLHSLIGTYGFKGLERMATGQSGQIELSLNIIKNIKIPLVTLVEQDRVIKQVKKIEKKVTDLESQLKDIPNQKETVLKKYL